MQFKNCEPANHQRKCSMQLQPVLLITLTKDWNLLSRPVMQVTTWHAISRGAEDDIVAEDEEKEGRGERKVSL